MSRHMECAALMAELRSSLAAMRSSLPSISDSSPIDDAIDSSLRSIDLMPLLFFLSPPLSSDRMDASGDARMATALTSANRRKTAMMKHARVDHDMRDDDMLAGKKKGVAQEILLVRHISNLLVLFL